MSNGVCIEQLPVTSATYLMPQYMHRHQQSSFCSMRVILFPAFLLLPCQGFSVVQISSRQPRTLHHSRQYEGIQRTWLYHSNSGVGSKSRLAMQSWEGDDLRWTTKWRRRLQRRSFDGDATPSKSRLMGLMFFMFVYQTITTVNFIRRGHPNYWPSHAFTILSDSILGTSVRGPLLMDLGYSNILAQHQPHRFLTSAFLHGGILHLLVNLDTMRRQPSWLETGLGGPLYWTTFLVSAVGGNLAHFIGINNPFDRTLVLGASGGICGLYGLMYGSLVRMGNGRAASRIARGIATIIISGFFFESISSLSHIGGFLCGITMAVLFSPSYRKNYSMRRKNSAEYDPAPRDFRQAMGFGVVPTERGMLPLSLLWVCVAIFLAGTRSEFRQIPALIVKGLLVPGSLTS